MLLIAADQEDTWEVYNVIENKVLNMQIRMPKKRYSGCSKGWLVTVEKDFSVTLINPFYSVQGSSKKENSIIRLPPLPVSKPWRWSWKYDYYVFKSIISSDPILDANDYIVVLVYEEFRGMAFIRLGKDETWFN
ncbi:hypothetical protein RchiOBHm_Chr3g0449861 [Rosa chinensis]|uniref:KIB1-4 beta-propeller domain-containing protein n=1 Tax=Rosa chinensis TaxID=74649 RepID=A0A2P6R5M3_ROSCH|nr:hypothetical protein RchiOBHm_Chr3g0449861 [Rosa chinensis]